MGLFPVHRHLLFGYNIEENYFHKGLTALLPFTWHCFNLAVAKWKDTTVHIVEE